MLNRYFGRMGRALVAALLLLLPLDAARALGPVLSVDEVGAEHYQAYAKLCGEVAVALESRDSEQLDRLLDSKRFVQRVMSGVELTAKKREEMAKGIVQSAGRLASLMVAQLPESPVVTPLRLHHAEGEEPLVECLLRLDLGDQGLGYWGVMIPPDSDPPQVADWYNYASVGSGSDSIRYSTLLLLSDNRTWIEANYGNAMLHVIVRKLLIDLFAAIRNRDVDAIERSYALLPERLRNNRYLLLMRMTAVSDNDEAYRHALADLQRNLGDDPRYALSLVDHYLLSEQYPQAHTALETFATIVGEDAALDELHANVALTSGDYQAGVDYARHAIERDPDYEDIYTTLFELLLKQQRHDDAVVVLQLLEQRFGYQFEPERLIAEEGYRAFTASAAFAAWRSQR